MLALARWPISAEPTGGAQVMLGDSRRALDAGDAAAARQLPAGAAEELVLHTRGFMGLDDDLSTSSLLQRAAAQGLAVSDGGAAEAGAYRQALADTETFKRVLQQARSDTLAALVAVAGMSSAASDAARACSFRGCLSTARPMARGPCSCFACCVPCLPLWRAGAVSYLCTWCACCAAALTP